MSTALVLMFVAGGLVFLNLRSTIFRRAGIHQVEMFGWPRPFYLEGNNEPEVLRPLLIENAITDIVLNISVLLNVAFLCEWLIRQSEDRRPS